METGNRLHAPYDPKCMGFGVLQVQVLSRVQNAQSSHDFVGIQVNILHGMGSPPVGSNRGSLILTTSCVLYSKTKDVTTDGRQKLGHCRLDRISGRTRVVDGQVRLEG